MLRRVLVHRIAWLLKREDCSPYSIMAVTFTNKAAAEMRHRIRPTDVSTQGGMWVGTFHGLAHRCCARTIWMPACRRTSVLDGEDQLRLLGRLIKAMNLDESSGRRAGRCGTSAARKMKGCARIIFKLQQRSRADLAKVYQAYQEACDRAGLVDFAELLLRFTSCG